jgi:hypothetical protein
VKGARESQPGRQSRMELYDLAETTDLKRYFWATP